MAKFQQRRYFINKPGYPMLHLAPVLSLAVEVAKRSEVQEVGFRQWFEVMWQQSDYTETPFDIPTEKDYWENWE